MSGYEELAEALEGYLQAEVRRRIERADGQRVQLVFGGPPIGALDELLARLTDDGKKDWDLGGGVNVAVLLIDGKGDPSGTGLGVSSSRARWDFAVTIRNRGEHSLVLVPPGEWDRRPESIGNASEMLGDPGVQRSAAAVAEEPWPTLVGRLAQRANRGALDAALRIVAEDSVGLEGRAAGDFPWEVLTALLRRDDLFAACGLPSRGALAEASDTVERARNVLGRLSERCAAVGMGQTFQELEDGRSALNQRDAAFLSSPVPLQALRTHLRSTAQSGAELARSSTYYYRPPTPVPAWWSVLTTEALEQLLASQEPLGRLQPHVAGVLNPGRLPSEPVLVQSQVAITVSDRSNNAVAGVGVRRQGTTLQPSTDSAFIEAAPPSHRRALKYEATASNYTAGTAKVISLDTFEARGYIVVAGAVKAKAPARRSDGTWEQEVVLRRGGVHDVTVHAASATTDVRIQGLADTPTIVGTRPWQFAAALETGSDLHVLFADSAGTMQGEMRLVCSIEDTDEPATSTRLGSLIAAHEVGQAEARPVVPRATRARALEDQYLSDDQSWRPVLGYWSMTAQDVGPIDWTKGQAGDLIVPAAQDYRPTAIELPAALAAARAELCKALRAMHRQLPECDLSTQPLRSLVAVYVNEYLEFLQTSPGTACWMDVMALFVPALGSQGLTASPAPGPAAICLSPLHPLRIGWHAGAQGILTSLDPACPLAALLNPHEVPGVSALQLFRRDEPAEWLAFLGVPCDDPHWSLFLHAGHLQDVGEHEALRGLTGWLGIPMQGLVGGVTRSQTMKALNDLSAVAPTRAVLRVGIAGGPSAATGAVEGIMAWAKERFEPQGAVPPLPSRLEVYDLRDGSMVPSAASLAILAESNTRWYKSPEVVPSMDLVVLDQIEALHPVATADSDARSILDISGLQRLSIRQDSGSAQKIREARIGRQDRAGPTTSGGLARAIVEFEQMAKRGGLSQFQFEPNQPAIADHVGQATFVAATSSQMDPACFIRGAAVDESYLWDYELPGVMGSDSERAGYYLVAKPRAATVNAIERTLQLVGGGTPDVAEVLGEICNRGIPVLKRLAGGGSGARGELGVFLAVRYLQDAFRSGKKARLPIHDGDCIHMLLGVDSYRAPLDAVRKSLARGTDNRRGDLLLFALETGSAGIRIRITVLEVKFREAGAQAGFLLESLGQARNLAELLAMLWVDSPPSELWDVCGRALLASCLDHCFRIYASRRLHGLDPASWAELHERVIHEVMGVPSLGDVVEVAREGRLLAFGDFIGSGPLDLDQDGTTDAAVFTMADCAALVDGQGGLSTAAGAALAELRLSLPGCGVASTMDVNTSTVRPANDPAKTVENTPAPAVSNQPVAVEPPEPPVSGEPANLAVVAPARDDPVIPEPVGDSSPPVDSSSSPVAAARSRVQSALSGYAGNALAVSQISRDVAAALLDHPPKLSRSYLLVGPPSTGKTELAVRMARAMDLPIVRIDGTALTSRERLFDLADAQLGAAEMSAEAAGDDMGKKVMSYPPFVVFVDEVHLIPKRVQESLLTMLSATERRVVLDRRVVLVPDATFIFATSRSSEVDKAFRTRCVTIHLHPYGEDDVAAIVKARAASEWGLELEDEAAHRVARLARSVPREAIELVGDLWREARLSADEPRSQMDMLNLVQASRGLDNNGLGKIHFDYLDVLGRQAGPLGEGALFGLLASVDRSEIVDELEPFLRGRGLIDLGPRGRQITPTGRDYLVRHRLGEQAKTE